MTADANWERRCPVDGCAAGLQRTIDGTVRDGVLRHLAVVHFGNHNDSMAKAEHYLAAIERADRSVERALGGDQL